ncbi:hypothetical protein J7L05_04245 [bacterium]|nr:hypothetical protein [bacterium]
MKEYFFHITLALILLCSSVCIYSCGSRTIVVKPSPKAPESEPEPIDIHDHEAIMKKMPSNNMVVNAEDEFDENAVNPIEFQSTFAILLNEGNQIGFTKEDFSSTARWNKLIRERNKKTASFQIRENIHVDKVIMLEEKTKEANDIARKFIEEIKGLEENHLVFFLSLDEKNENQLDLYSSFVGLNLDNPARHGVDKLRELPGVMFEDEHIFIFRAATYIPKQFKKFVQLPD